MLDLLRDLINDLKVELTFKEVAKFFLYGLLITTFIFLIPMKKELNSETVFTIFGFALVFAGLYVATKSYSHFLDNYYQGHIDRYNKKHGIKTTTNKKNKKK